jgi:hypothetical protein
LGALYSGIQDGQRTDGLDLAGTRLVGSLSSSDFANGRSYLEDVANKPSHGHCNKKSDHCPNQMSSSTSSAHEVTEDQAKDQEGAVAQDDAMNELTLMLLGRSLCRQTFGYSTG